MKTFRLALVFCFLILHGPAFAKPAEPLANFLGPQGCAIGPSTRALAAEAGYENDVIEALVSKAMSDPQTVRTGEWIVLPPGLCRIQPFDLRSEIRIDDPDVKLITSRIDAYAKDGIHGCFLFGPTLMDVVEKTRGWSKDKAYLEWVQFAVENLRAGTIAFYGTDPAKPPPGFLVLTGACADIAEIAAIRRSQVIRDQEFDFFIRANAPDVVCGSGRFVSPRANEIVRARLGNANTNEWMPVEIAAIASAVGWSSDIKALQSGAQRPPFCRAK